MKIEHFSRFCFPPWKIVLYHGSAESPVKIARQMYQLRDILLVYRKRFLYEISCSKAQIPFTGSWIKRHKASPKTFLLSVDGVSLVEIKSVNNKEYSFFFSFEFVYFFYFRESIEKIIQQSIEWAFIPVNLRIISFSSFLFWLNPCRLWIWVEFYRFRWAIYVRNGFDCLAP